MTQVSFVPARLELRATQIGEKITQTVTLRGWAGATQPKLRVASHPHDPPHQRGRHPWIELEPLAADRLKITVDTQQLRPNARFTREIALQMDDAESQLWITVETAPIQLIPQVPSLLLAPFCLALMVVWAVTGYGPYAPANMLGVLLLGIGVGYWRAPTPGFQAQGMKLVWSFLLLSFLGSARAGALVGAIAGMTTGLWSEFRGPITLAPGPELLAVGALIGALGGGVIGLMTLGRKWLGIGGAVLLGLGLGMAFAYWGGVAVLAGEFFKALTGAFLGYLAGGLAGLLRTLGWQRGLQLPVMVGATLGVTILGGALGLGLVWGLENPWTVGATLGVGVPLSVWLGVTTLQREQQRRSFKATALLLIPGDD